MGLRDRSHTEGESSSVGSSLWRLGLAYLYVAMLAHIQSRLTGQIDAAAGFSLGYWILPLGIWCVLSTGVAWWVFVVAFRAATPLERHAVSFVHAVSTVPAMYGTILALALNARNEAFILDGLSATLLASGQLILTSRFSKQQAAENGH